MQYLKKDLFRSLAGALIDIKTRESFNWQKNNFFIRRTRPGFQPSTFRPPPVGDYWIHKSGQERAVNHVSGEFGPFSHGP